MKSWESLSEALREMTVAEGLTYSELSKRTGVPKPSLVRFLNRDRGLNLATADILMKHFGLVVIERPRQRPTKKGR